MSEKGSVKYSSKGRFRIYSIIAILLIISMVAVLSACNNTSDEEHEGQLNIDSSSLNETLDADVPQDENLGASSVSITLTDEEYEKQLGMISDSDVFVMFDADVPLSGSPEGSDESSDYAHPYAAEVLALVNIEREKAGLPPLNGGYKELNEAAQARAEELVISFSHTRPNGQSWKDALTEYTVSFRAAGENVAKGHRTPEIVVGRWMASSGHKANMMDTRFNNIGIGVAADQRGILHWVQLFTN